MPELPEVETTVRGISPLLVGRRITNLVVRESRLRWPIPETLADHIINRQVTSVSRRAKYILIGVESGHILIHLGMSGSLRFAASGEHYKFHDHVDLEIDNERALRFHDPRRFGCVLWIEGNPAQFKLLRNLGPEPLADGFNADYLYAVSRARRTAVKNLIMDSRVVVGVGNIYASEALFRAGIRPGTRASRISRPKYHRLVKAIEDTLSDAITAGGTTLRDFVNGYGAPGYFRQELAVYERAGKACKSCQTPISRKTIGQRSTYYCRTCQK
ncbi:MAG: bifunctional DNA-formamidopyrimidine glycosylase/DNA-(apurinic or apyrimidinic site) lyase [Acidiferrobacterales bacterium]|nr:bifunctional DNA-formamidopyrimidine glycosylase/DNA-(apurinic or apyrimidinic site) lyase [Acidiferrobacterales bacterium]